MSTLLIEGGHRLSGSVDVEGNKNAALPLLAACLLTTEECVLTNVPRIKDVDAMAQLLVDLGASVDGVGLGAEALEDDAALEPGMVVQLELDAHGVLGADLLLIGDAGAEVLTAFPYAAGRE